ncbi:O-antigen ligase family protein [Noviherbaspirillum sp. DKR-6]|uniref:O-antigen ligase family protein n=1 Tax=Noviherbaspirillum pedocola TaxID=2801341 RepID=A0A934VZY1_9BURK|nr:O-antigen ligase family protein [Noviherbaspirillum pedocola]
MRYLQALIAASLIAFFAFALIIDRAAGVLYGALILTSLAALLSRSKPENLSFTELLRCYWPLILALAAPLFAVLANEMSRGHFSGRNMDAPLRLALFPLALWAVWLLPIARLRQLQWAFVAGAVLSAIKIYLLSHNGQDRYVTDFIPITIFIEMGMLLGVYALLSIAWNARGNTLSIALKLVAAIAILYGSYISQSRGAWVTIPLFAAIALVACNSMKTKTKLAIAAALVVTIALAGGNATKLRERVEVARNDIQQYLQKSNVDTSIGIRFQLWRGSMVIFSEHPIFGVGVDRYRDALKDLAARKIISPTASTYAHSHNEMLFAMARLGLVGLAAMLALLLVPATYFARDLRHADGQVRASACMGLSLCTGLLLLGFTDVVFLWWEVFPFYSLSIASFIAFAAKRKAKA